MRLIRRRGSGGRLQNPLFPEGEEEVEVSIAIRHFEAPSNSGADAKDAEGDGRVLGFLSGLVEEDE